MKKIFLLVMILMSLYANAAERKNGYAKVSTDDDLYDPSLGNKMLVYKLSTGGYVISTEGNINSSARAFIEANQPGQYKSPEEAIRGAISLGVCGSKRADYKRYSCYTDSGDFSDIDDKTKGSKNLPNLPNPNNNNSSNATNNNNPNNGMQASNKPAEPNKPQQPTPQPTPNPQSDPVPTPKIPNVPKIPSEEWINKWRDHWISIFESFSQQLEEQRKALPNTLQRCRIIYSPGSDLSSQCVNGVLESYKKTIEGIKERIGRARSDMEKEAAEISRAVKNINKNVPHPNAGGDDGDETSQNGNGNNNANPNGENGYGNTTNNFGGDTNVTNNNVTVNNNSSKTVVNKGDGKGDGNQVGIDKGNSDGEGNGKKGNCEGDKGTVGCAQLGSEKDYPKDGSISIGKSDFGLPSFSRSNNFVEQGSCPAPKSITLMGTVQVVDYSQLCNGALKLRPIIIACAIFIAFGIVRSAIISKT